MEKHKSNTVLYRRWTNMKVRCNNVKHTHYKSYGGRGICVCTEWMDSYQSFAEWAINNGYSKELTLDRINNDGNYEPSNCRWVTITRQANNKSTNVLVTIGDKTQSIADWCRELNLNYGTVKHRISRDKMTHFEALTKPIKVIYPSIKIWNEEKRQKWNYKQSNTK